MNVPYRPDIDGLRAIAVISVLLFHLFPSILPGGFIGVDVFFVISGYLITTIIVREQEGGCFSFLKFYSRRIRRIFPALLLVLTVSYFLGLFILHAAEFKIFCKHIMASVFFVSNILQSYELGYFEFQSVLNPAHHLWSLGIEEQFYIFWPVILWLGRYAKFNLLTLTSFVTLTSFGLNMRGMETDTINTFFLPLTRVWEISSGGLLALYCSNSTDKILQKRGKEFLSIAGVVLLACGLFVLNHQSIFPGKNALIPVIASVLIISAGSETWINKKIFSNRAAIWVGIISYPIYLWHWPLISLGVLLIPPDYHLEARLAIIILTIFLARLTYDYLEVPLKNKTGLNKIAIFLLVLSFALAAVAYLTYRRNGRVTAYNEKYSTQKMEEDRNKHWEDYNSFLNKRNETIEAFPTDPTGQQPGIVLIGNSWGIDVAVSLAIAGLPVVFESMTGHLCDEFTLPLLQKGQRDFLKWLDLCSQNARRFASIPHNTKLVILADHRFLIDQYEDHKTLKAFENNLHSLRKIYKGPVLVVKGRPSWGLGGLRLATFFNNLNASYNKDIQGRLYIALSDLRKISAYYKEFYARYSDVYYLDLIEPFCPKDECQLFGNRTVYYFDSYHLTTEGAAFVAPFLKKSVFSILK